MLATARQVQDACTLNIEQVRQAMCRTGYKIGPKEIVGVEFKGMNAGGQFVYEIFGNDPEGNDDISLGNVYLQFQRAAFDAKFELYGDY
jgi:hypothetical protein